MMTKSKQKRLSKSRRQRRDYEKRRNLNSYRQRATEWTVIEVPRRHQHRAEVDDPKRPDTKKVTVVPVTYDVREKAVKVMKAPLPKPDGHRNYPHPKTKKFRSLEK